MPDQPHEVPHLQWPFRLRERRMLTVEQDSIEDVRQNVFAYLSTDRGERSLSPDFGVEDLTFAAGVDVDQLEVDIEEAEDRADVTVEAVTDGAGRWAINVNVELAE